MSLATRCTNCGTIFRVVQDQLKVSEGWVRCGRCQEVFSALEGLFDLEREAPPQRADQRPQGSEDGDATATSPQAAHTEADEPGRAPATDSTDFDPFSAQDREAQAHTAVASVSEDDAIESRFLVHPDSEDRSRDLRLDASRDEPQDGAAQEFFSPHFGLNNPAPASAAAFGAGATEPASTTAAADRSLIGRWKAHRDSQHSARASSMLEPTLDGASTAMPASTDDPVVSTNYLSDDVPPSAWHRPAARAGLSVAAVLLVSGLLLQVAYQFRDVFATQWPQSRDAVAMLCEWTGCKIEPLRRLSAVTVEDSGLTQVQGSAEAYRLSVTLHNRSAFAVAIPSIDLSLTDGGGTLVSRRALMPADFSGAPAPEAGSTLATLPPGGEAQLQALLASRGARLSGYTVELFYP